MKPRQKRLYLKRKQQEQLLAQRRFEQERQAKLEAQRLAQEAKLKAEQEKAAEDSIESAKAITTASMLNINELKNMSVLMGLSPDLDDMMLKAKIIQFASDNPAKFTSTLEDVDKEHRIFLKNALQKEVLTKINGVWKHGSNNIGLTDDQAIIWLKENADLYAMLKHQMRTGEAAPVEVEEKIEVKKDSSTPQGIKELME